MKKSYTSSLCATLALAFAIVCLPANTRAADQMKGGPHLLHLLQIDKQSQAEALKPGDEIAMVCTKCKSAMVHRVETEKGHIKLFTVGEKHMCPGCNSTITVVGVGKGKHDEVKHTCAKCGDDSVFCCATKPGQGRTRGMEK